MRAKVDFVEQNPTAQEELPKLMKVYKIPDEIWNLNNCTIEEYIVFKLISDFRQIVRRIEESFDETLFEIAVEYLQKIKEEVKDFDSKNRIYMAIEEAIILLNDPELDYDKISKACNLAEAFGRGQQYVSMMKK